MSFVRVILENLRRRPDHVFLQEARDGALHASPGSDLSWRVGAFRSFLRSLPLRPGDRCALVGSNSVAWVAADLALLAEGLVAVPLYHRARPAELATILRDARPSLLLGDSREGLDALAAELGGGLPAHVLDDVLAAAEAGADSAGDAVAEDAAEDDAVEDDAVETGEREPVAILYTSGTSGEPKGVVLHRGNLEFMIDAAGRRLDLLMRGHPGAERAFHYLPFCFAGSWLMLLLGLTRGNTLTLNRDLTRIVEDLALARPHYFQNVPVLLDRVREGVEAALRRRGGPVWALWQGAFRAVVRRADGGAPRRRDRLALAASRKLLFPSIRRRIGADLRALICGSAPLSRDTQLFFGMIGIPVLQVYGLTETTAICTMDAPDRLLPGRVGCAIPGVEMRLGEMDEILVRGPNVFPGYWNRPDDTAAAFTDGWFRTGDQGEADADGNWRILGRVKDLIVPSSGHNVAPEPLEAQLASRLDGARQVVVLGTGRPHLVAVVTGDVDAHDVERALEEMNGDLPHYRKIRGSIVVAEPFTIESGLLTANGKLRRDAIAARLADRIDALYAAAGVGA
jgi:long-chain acyl-CoA synthetase